MRWVFLVFFLLPFAHVISTEDSNTSMMHSRIFCFIFFSLGYLVGLVIFQDLTWSESGVLADVIQFADGINRRTALAGDRIERFTL